MLDLVPQSSVKVNDVTVGKVTDIELDGWHAEVTVALNGDVELPDDSRAEIRQTSLLGEKFVSLAPPAERAGANLLSEGDVIPLDRSGRNPEVEEVLGAMSLLLNGGGVAQLKTIATELNKAFEGRESDVKSVLRQLDTFMAPARREQEGHRAGHRVPQRARGVDRRAARLHRARRSTRCPRPSRRSTSSATTWCGCSTRSTSSAPWAPR